MKCISCNAEWTVSDAISASITICPFCGASLYPQPASELTSLQSVLKAIIAHSGVDALRDGRRTLAIFADLAPKLRKEKIMISYLVQCDGHIALIDALRKSFAEQIAIRGRVAQQMIDNFLISEDIAYRACDCYWDAIGGKVLQESTTRLPTSDSHEIKSAFPPALPAKLPPKSQRSQNYQMASRYQHAIDLFRSALSKEEFQYVEAAFRALGSYRDSEQMAINASMEWSFRVKKANELYQAFLNLKPEIDPSPALQKDIDLLNREKDDCEAEQNRRPALQSQLESLRTRRNTLSSDIRTIKNRITELSSQTSFFSFFGAKERAAQIENLRRDLSRLEKDYEGVCKNVSATQDSINNIPAPYQARSKIQEIDTKLQQKMSALSAAQQKESKRIQELCTIRTQLLEHKYLRPLIWDPTKTRVLSRDNQIAAEILKIQSPVSQQTDTHKWDNSIIISNDAMFSTAVDSVLETGQASFSMLQSRLKLGYIRSINLINEMEIKGLVGPLINAKPREILITKEQWESLKTK